MAKVLSYQRLKHMKIVGRMSSKITKPNLKTTEVAVNNTLDRIGPPDVVSNLRPIIFAKSENETTTEKKYREAREITQKWNQEFWSEHNAKFIAERKKFQSKLKTKGKDSVTADEMSVFYKRFLDENWRNHLNYNISWYKQNLYILFLEIKVRISKLKFK